MEEVQPQEEERRANKGAGGLCRGSSGAPDMTWKASRGLVGPAGLPYDFAVVGVHFNVNTQNPIFRHLDLAAAEKPRALVAERK